MPTGLEQKIRTAAAAYSPLTALLASGSPATFRWYRQQLAQGSAFPAVVVRVIFNARDYVATGALPTSTARVQFDIWGGEYAAGMAAADAVQSALYSFLDQLNLVGVPGLSLYPNRVVSALESSYTQANSLIYGWLTDAMIFSNESL